MDIHTYPNKEIPQRAILNQWSKTIYPKSGKKYWNAIQELQNNVSSSAWDLFERKMKIQGMLNLFLPGHGCPFLHL